MFRGGTAVLTGAANGIGEALAYALAERGSNLAFVDRDGDGLARVVAEIERRHPEVSVTAYVEDLARTDQLQALAERLSGDLSAITLLINNAGVALGGRFEQISVDDFDWLMRINVTAPVHLTHALLPRLREYEGSHLVMVSSVYGLFAPPGQTAYAASKFALRGFTDSLRHELAGSGVGVTAVYPGGVKTGIADNARLGAGVDRREAVRATRQFNRLLRIEPASAAEQILVAVESRRPRLLIGSSAKIPDLLARLMPSRYWSVVAAIARTRSRRPRARP